MSDYGQVLQVLPVPLDPEGVVHGVQVHLGAYDLAQANEVAEWVGRLFYDLIVQEGGQRPLN